MDPITFLRRAYVITTLTLMAGLALPWIRNVFYTYGSRASGRQNHESRRLIDFISGIIPHTWFTQFYIVSVLCSLFWAQQILFDGWAFEWIADRTPVTPVSRSMTTYQVILVWFCMFGQGCRRLWETLEFQKESKAKMGILHWMMGVLFYVGATMAVWIEGIPTLLIQKPSWRHFIVVPPTFRTFVFFSVFLMASGIQHDCHRYLTSLKKYTLPEHPIFQRLICPHYTMECAIYLSLTFLAAPRGSLVNTTLTCVLFFVVTNLAVTAESTRQFYARKFGEDKIRGRWRMIPWLY